MEQNNNNNKIDCYILAAGEASRMFPLNSIMEKSLLPIDGIPVIRRIITKIMEHGIARNIHICCLDKFKKQFQHEFRDLFNVEIIGFERPWGTYSTYFAVVDGHTSEWSMVHYADCITDIDYKEFVSYIDKIGDYKNIDGVIAITSEVKHDYSEVLCNDEDEEFPSELPNVAQFIEKPHIRTYTWSGIGLFRSENIQKYYDIGAPGQDFAFDIFPQMINKGKLRAYRYNKPWYDVGNLNSYRKVCEMMYNNGV